MRKLSLETGEIYHIFNRSIAEYKIFNNEKEFLRMINAICYYRMKDPAIKFFRFLRSNSHKMKNLSSLMPSAHEQKLVDIIAYCIMPTHIHLILKQLKKDGISVFMRNIQNSYARYFNTKHERKGHLWEGRFKNVLISTDEQLLHATRYLHLNPVTARLVDKPENWIYSSYREYLMNVDDKNRICSYNNNLEIDPISYKQFTEDQISYQRELGKSNI